MTKEEGRIFAKNFRTNLIENKSEKDLKIIENLKSRLDLKNFKQCFVYVSLKDEIQTISLIAYFFENSIEVFVPKIKNKEMIAVKINSLTDLEVGHFQVLEPKNESDEKFENSKNTLIILPCLMLDKHLNRLGYGKGYYDRFIQNSKSVKVALCYEQLVIEKLEISQYDEKVDMIITEN